MAPPLLYSVPTPTISICLFHHVFTQYVKLFILEAFGHWYIITLFLFYFALQLQHHGNVFWKFIEADTYSIAKRGITLLLCPWQKSDERVTLLTSPHGLVIYNTCTQAPDILHFSHHKKYIPSPYNNQDTHCHHLGLISNYHIRWNFLLKLIWN